MYYYSMLVKPIDKAEIEEPKPKVMNSLAGVKVAFLVVLFALGFFMVSQSSHLQVKKPVQLQEKPSSTESKPILKPEQIVSKEDLEKTKESLISASKQKTKEVSGFVLGEATKHIMPIASKSAEMAADYVYENTLEEVIKRLIEVLPERRQKVLEDWLKKS